MTEFWKRLGDGDSELLRKALTLCADSALYPDWEFQTLMGFYREEVREAATRWPELGMDDESALALLVSVVGNMSGYPHSRTEIEFMNSNGLSETVLRELLVRLNEAYSAELASDEERASGRSDG